MVAEVTEHGRSGYRRGCKCATCRGAHATYMASWRSRRRERQIAEAFASGQPLVADPRPAPEPTTVPAALDMAAKPGPLERALLEDLANPSEKVAFQRHLVGLGRLNARILDQVSALDRLDLVSPLQLRQLEVLSRLAILGFAGMDDDSGEPGGEGSIADEASKLLAELAQGGDE